MALFQGTGLVKFHYAFDGSTDFVRKGDILGISTSVEPVDSQFALRIDVALTGNTHMELYGELLADYADATACCEAFCNALDKALEEDCNINNQVLELSLSNKVCQK